MVLFGSTMKQWQLALSLSVGPGAQEFVAECDPFCDIEFVFQYVHPDTGAGFHEECVIAVREHTNSHLKFYQRDVTKGVWSHWTRPVAVVSKIFSGSDPSFRGPSNVPSSSFLNSDQAEHFRRCFPQCAVRAWRSVSVVTSD